MWLLALCKEKVIRYHIRVEIGSGHKPSGKASRVSDANEVESKTE